MCGREVDGAVSFLSDLCGREANKIEQVDSVGVSKRPVRS
ncbi:hypothetical protein EJK51_0026 [Moraxella catarrhalis]|nr:hypothetical protein EJK52_0027 [Moraxella catarrhalis]AZQ90435.1 hypothetical protein EJK51_0026 [Moraxella catarrhalis]